MLVGKVLASKMVVREMPDSPLSRRFQTDSMEWPMGVTQPIPVMTTRCFISIDHPQRSPAIAIFLGVGLAADEDHGHSQGDEHQADAKIKPPAEGSSDGKHDHRENHSYP